MMYQSIYYANKVDIYPKVCPTFYRLISAKYTDNFPKFQPLYKVNSPRRGRRIKLSASESGKFLPKTYMSFVTAASIVMSCPDTTPASCRANPVSYRCICTAPSLHCETFTTITPLAIASLTKSTNHSDVGALPAP